MALTQLAPPYPIFTDRDGSPLDNGFLYFGLANQNPETNPITVYYDRGFTQPVAQPVRTSNGYVMRNGSPALIYADSQFSVTVRNKRNELVIYSPVGFGVVPGIPFEIFENAARDVSALLADTHFTYAAGVPNTIQVATGDILRTLLEGFSYEVAASGASDQDVTTAGGVKLYVRTGDDCPLAYGAAGDGATNDKSFIDALNVANTVVDLGFSTYAYTGDFAPVAVFKNGKIVSSTLGQFDYSTGKIVEPRTITVGPSGTIKTLQAALDWLQSGIEIDAVLTLTLSGNHTLSNYTFNHPNSDNVLIIGTALAGAMPTKADMVGVRATDEATILARFTATIDVGGTGDNTTGGWRIPYGLSRLENVAVKSNTRYSIDVGFSSSHASSRSVRRFAVANIAVIGGVWGIIAVNCQFRLTAGTSMFMAYQNTGTQPGGPVDFVGGMARLEGNYRVYSAGQSSKYALYAESGARVFADNVIDVVGPFLHGAHAGELSQIFCNGMVTDGVSQPITAQPSSHIKCLNYSFSNGDVANTNTLTGSQQTGWGNNNSSSAVVFAGQGATVSLNDGTMNNMVALYAFHSIGGQICQGTVPVDIDDCRWALAAGRFYGSNGNYLALNVTNPKAGSLDQVVALAQSTVRMGTNSGVSFSPAINTTSNGNLISDTG